MRTLLEFLGVAARRLADEVSAADQNKLAKVLGRFANDGAAQQAKREFAAACEKYCPQDTRGRP